MGWQNLTRGGPGVRWLVDPGSAFNGNVSVGLTRAGVEGEHTRVGVAARGLYHQGYWLRRGKPYEGYLAVRAARASVVHVRLEDWGADPKGAHGSVVLAHALLSHPGGGPSRAKSAPRSWRRALLNATGQSRVTLSPR